MSTVNELRHLHFLLTTDRVDDAMKIMRFSDDPTLRAFSEQFHDGTLSVADIRACIETRQADGPQSPRSFVRMPVPVSPARVQSVPVDTAPPVEVVSPLQPLHPVEATPDDQHPPEIIIALSPSDGLAPPDTRPPGNGYAPIRWTTIVFVSLLLVSLFGAVLAACNWRRLGRPGLFLVTLIGPGFVILLLWFITITAIRTTDSINVSTATINILLFGTSLLPGLLLGLWQRPAFNAWMAQYSAQRPMLKKWSGLTNALAGGFVVVISFANILGLMILWPSVESLLAPGGTFENADLRLTYPGGWVVVQPEDYTAEGREFCNQSGVTCQVVLARPGGVIELQVTDYTGLSLLLMTAGAFDETIRDQRTAAGAEVIRQQALQINGREVSRTVLLMPDQSVRSYTVVKPQPTTITVISFYAPDDVTYLRLKPDVDAIFASMEFITPE